MFLGSCIHISRHLIPRVLQSWVLPSYFLGLSFMHLGSLVIFTGSCTFVFKPWLYLQLVNFIDLILILEFKPKVKTNCFHRSFVT